MGAPGPSPPPRRTHIGLIAGVSVLVVVIVLVAGLWAAGVGPFSRTSNGGGDVTFSEAASSAEAAAQSQPGGPWTLAGGEGLLTEASVSENVTNLTGAFGSEDGCSSTLLAGVGTQLSLPGSTASASAGTASGWSILFLGSASLLLVAVIGGSATPLLTIGGSSCEIFSVGAKIALPSGYVDSSTAASDAYSDGGSAFASNHSTFDTTFEIAGATSFTFEGVHISEPATWTVEMTNCNLGSGSSATLDGAAASEFEAQLNATTGAEISAKTEATTCAGTSSHSKTSIGSVLALGTINEASAGKLTWYNTSVAMAAEGMVWSDTEFEVETAAGSEVHGVLFLNATNELGSCLDAVYEFSDSSWSAPPPPACSGATGGSEPIEAGDGLSIVSTVSLTAQGDVLDAFGEGAYSGNIVVAIP